MLLEEIHFAFVNGIPAEAKEYVEKNQDDYGGFFHVLNYHMNDADIYRPEVYLIEDPSSLVLIILLKNLSCLIF